MVRKGIVWTKERLFEKGRDYLPRLKLTETKKRKANKELRKIKEFLKENRQKVDSNG